MLLRLLRPRSFRTVAAALLAASTAMLAAGPAGAGVANPVQRADSSIIYFGVVPAGLTRNHPGERPGTLMHGGVRTNSVHDIHVMVAAFDRASGARITNASVTARFIGERGRRWSLTLQPMTINRALTYGGYTSMGVDENASILVDVVRPNRKHKDTVRFEYEHD